MHEPCTKKELEEIINRETKSYIKFFVMMMFWFITIIVLSLY